MARNPQQHTDWWTEKVLREDLSTTTFARLEALPHAKPRRRVWTNVVLIVAGVFALAWMAKTWLLAA